MVGFAKVRGPKARRILVVPVLNPRLSSAWIHLVTPIPSYLARPLVDGLVNEVVVHDDAARKEFSEIQPLACEGAVQKALDRYSMPKGPQTTVRRG